MKPKCPKCGDPVSQSGSMRGVPRWQHTTRVKRRDCGWHGALPVGLARAEAEGIDRTAADALHRRVRGLKVARYVITAAQNATPINERFFASLLTYCHEHQAELLVIPYRYRNPTSMWSDNARGDDWWAAGLAPYLIDKRVDLNPNLVLLADIKTQPTASAPLQGFETLTGGRSAIIGHPRLELITVAAPQHRMAKILTTTGAVTKKNYIPCKAGAKGEHHHTFGACVVEVSGKKFHMRQINATRDGSFIDLDREYDGDAIYPAGRALALVMGDSHIQFIDPGVVKATFDGPDSIIGVLQPEQLVWHDASDQYARNHHHRGRVFIDYVKHHEGRDDVERELDADFAFIDAHTPPDTLNVFVASNHPDALARWVEETDPRSDPVNAVFWAQTFTAMCEGAEWTETGARTIDPYAYWGMRKLKTADVAKFLGRRESHRVADIECSFHADVGPNGAKGSRKAFAKIGVKTITGHVHSPGITGGAYGVGTSSRLDLEYALGPSSWLKTHCAVYRNGKRSLINVIGDEWRA